MRSLVLRQRLLFFFCREVAGAHNSILGDAYVDADPGVHALHWLHAYAIYRPMHRWIEKSDFRRGRTCVFALHVHLVFLTKKRRHVLTGEDIAFLHEHFAMNAAKKGATITQMDGEDDHVHLLVEYGPTVSLSNLVNSLKGSSSKALREHRPEIHKQYGLHNSLWSPSYFAASCGGAPLSSIKKYVENQRTPQ